MNKKITTLLMGLAFSPAVMALPVSGLVKDSKSGEPLIGIVVQLKGNTAVSTTTGLDGSFKLNGLPESGVVTLVVEYVGYKTKEIKVDVGSEQAITVNLDEDSKELGEVVVTGFKKRDTDRSAVELVKNSSQVLCIMSQQAIQLSPDVNVVNVLQRVSGVTM